MSTATVRISATSHRALRDLAEREKASLQTVVERAIENYRRSRFLDAVNAQYAALRADPAAWNAEVTERDEWSATASDGLEE